MSEALSTVRRRTAIYDGLRGIAIIVIILHHGWMLWPTEDLHANPVTNTLFRAGNSAVSIFFVVGFFLATRSMLNRAGTEAGVRPAVLIIRRYVRFAGSLVFALAALTVITASDDVDEFTDSQTRQSLFRIMTFTWNQFLQQHALDARSDLGHLWYLSVDFQVFVFVVLLVWLLQRHRAWLVVALGGVLLFCFAWRYHVYQTEGIYQALLRTTVRMDAPLMGAFAAAAMPYLARVRWSSWMGAAALVALVPLSHLAVEDEDFFLAPGVGVSIALALFMVATSLAEPPAWMTTFLSFRPLAYLGEHSLTIFIWHYPIFWLVSRHSQDWTTFERTVTGLTIALGLAWISDLLVERRVQKFLAADSWRDMERLGLVPWLVSRLRNDGRQDGTSTTGDQVGSDAGVNLSKEGESTSPGQDTGGDARADAKDDHAEDAPAQGHRRASHRA
ncbi:acyltransferase family protein [Nocardioides houyundeii]|uniref:acyltransferase family protein n=1 Tax=Nocardioides houyundeii TaxID=2045452 RepID=UPI000C78E0DC|nr:acyltransferase [Nocardioides houyundeii]